MTGHIPEERPTVLVLASTYPRWQGDPEPGFVHELAKRLTDRFRVVVLGPHAPGALDRETLDGVDVHRYRYAPEWLETLVNDGGIMTNLRNARWKLLLVPGFVLAQALCAWRLLRTGGIDVVHAHWLVPQGLVAALLQLMPGRAVPFVVTSHGADLFALRAGPFQALKRFVLQRAASATVVSTAMHDHLRGIGADVSKVSVQPMGVDFAGRFSPDEEVQRDHREILFVGRLVEKKGLGHLLAAMPAVLKAFPDAGLTIAGFGPEEAALKVQVQTLGLERNVRFLGAVSQADLPGLYRRAAVFVAPFVRAQSGDEEGFGLVLAEAAGCECPVVAGNVSAVRDLLGPTTQCVDPRNPTALADAVIRVIEDPHTARKRVLQLREDLLGRLDWRIVAGNYVGILSDCLHERRTAYDGNSTGS